MYVLRSKFNLKSTDKFQSHSLMTKKWKQLMSRNFMQISISSTSLQFLVKAFENFLRPSPPTIEEELAFCSDVGYAKFDIN